MYHSSMFIKLKSQSALYSVCSPKCDCAVFILNYNSAMCLVLMTGSETAPIQKWGLDAADLARR